MGRCWRLAPEILRTSVACLALAVGFAGLAQRPGAELPLLLDLLAAWYKLVAQWSPRRPASRRGLVSPQEMVKRLVDPEPPGVEPADPGGRR